MAAHPIRELIEQLWSDYSAVNPQALRIHKLLSDRGEVVHNDHIAFRTFGVKAIGISAIATPFIEAGYTEKGHYTFKNKHLRAVHYEPPEADLPKVFVSELILDEVPAIADICHRLAAQVSGREHGTLCIAGRPWDVDFTIYEQLLERSEYAAWLAAFGFRANHFTINVNRLTTFSGLSDLTAFLTERGFAMNESGGLIKGGARQLLAQSSTLAAETEVALGGEHRTIPGCYYEFAERFHSSDGTLFQGFVPESADHLFNATDVRR